jgi:hypothetical protein
MEIEIYSAFYQVGGRNTVLERAFVPNGIPFVSDVPTIIFGADVTHPTAGEDSSASIAAVCFLFSAFVSFKCYSNLNEFYTSHLNIYSQWKCCDTK